MRITKLIINNFRAFKHAEIDFNDFNCIIGKNDSGKSTILAALEWFFSNDKELNKYDINANIEYENEEISVELYFSNATFHPTFVEQEFLDSEGIVRIKKALTNPNSFDSDFVKPIPYYSLRVFRFNQKEILSFCKLDNLMEECINVGIKRDLLEDRLSALNKCTDEGSKMRLRGKYNKLIPLMRKALYNYYSNSNFQTIEDKKLFTESEWFEWLYEWSYFWMPPFLLYTPQTPINDYLNKLFNNYFMILEDERTEEISKKISKAIGANVSIGNLSNYFNCNFFPNNKNAPIITTKNESIIPLNNRGDGFQQKVKSAVYRLFAEQGNQHSCIFAFEEPETHLHPSAQIEMYETIKALSEQTNYQVIITTHSPYIVKELAKNDILPIVVKREESAPESKISKLDECVLPYVSMSEINYIAFEEPSVEYHQELFAFLQGGEKTVDQVDAMFEKEYNWFQVDNKGKLVIKDGSPIEKKHSLPYCVRNQINHPLDDDISNTKQHDAYLNNKRFANPNLIRESIEIMRNAIRTLDAKTD